MAEHFRFFDSANPNEPDRTYNAQEFTDYFKALVTTGIMKGTGNQLKVTTTGANMISSVDTGIAFLLGRYYENDSLLALLHETESVGRDRIDRIVIRMDLSTEARNVKAFIKKGVSGTVPVAPPLTQTANLYEISLSQVSIKGGQTYISTNAVTDERGTDVICPWAGSKILPNFDNIALADLVNKVDEGLVDASTTVKGIVKLNDNLNSTSVSEAATANSVGKKANKIQENEIVATLRNGWNQNIFDKVRFYKDQFGIVHITGKAEISTGAGDTVFVLPVNYRPSNGVYIVASVGYGNAISGRISEDGSVLFSDKTAITSAGAVGFETHFRI